MEDHIEINKLRVVKEIYLIAHYTTADICSWSDFENIKEYFGISQKSFISITKSYNFQGWQVKLRDTALLAPPPP